MEERYSAAHAISQLPASDIRDSFWREWKMSIHGIIDALLVEMNSVLTPLRLKAQVCYASSRSGATLYIQALSSGKWFPPTAALPPIIVPQLLPENPPFQWNPAFLSPHGAATLQTTIGASVLYLGGNQPPRKVSTVTPSKTLQYVCCVPLCDLYYSDFVHIAVMDGVDTALARTPRSIVEILPYAATFR